MKFDLNFT